MTIVATTATPIAPTTDPTMKPEIKREKGQKELLFNDDISSKNCKNVTFSRKNIIFCNITCIFLENT